MATIRGLLCVCTAVAALVAASSARAAGQNLDKTYQPVPAAQRPALHQRAAAYVRSFRQGDWATLFDLVSYDGKRDISKKHFAWYMSENHHSKNVMEEYPLRLRHFAPDRTLVSQYGGFDIYGCVTGTRDGDFPEGSVGILHAVYEKDQWVFTGWQFLDPGASCSVLATPGWKPPRPPAWGEPMIEILCVVATCTL